MPENAPKFQAIMDIFERTEGTRVEWGLAIMALPATPPRSPKENRMDGAGLIAAERERQVGEERWSPEHDDSHSRGQLADAAVAYLDRDASRWPFGYQADGPDGHGSSGGGFVHGKPKLTPDDRVRELVKAGALIAAEIDRLKRSGATDADS